LMMTMCLCARLFPGERDRDFRGKSSLVSLSLSVRIFFSSPRIVVADRSSFFLLLLRFANATREK
jgi:hypothetical protein